YSQFQQSQIPTPKPREAIRRLCPVVGSWPDRDFTTKATAILETELTAAGVPHDLKVYPGTKHAFFNDTLRSYHAGAAADSWRVDSHTPLALRLRLRGHRCFGFRPVRSRGSGRDDSGPIAKPVRPSARPCAPAD